MNIREEKECRVCKGELKEILNLGYIFPSGFTNSKEPVGEKAPLVLTRCNNCGLVQLKHTVDLDLMYRQYWYSSSLNKSMITSLKDVVDDVESKIELSKEDTVVDIGCNDGTLLALYCTENLTKVGYDPALNLKKPDGVYFINDYFSNKGYFDIYGHLKAKVVTAIAMFYDLPDPIKFVLDVKDILHEDGIFVVQFTDLLSMIKATAFDNICHEHLEYYRLEDVINILESCGLQVVDVSYNTVNGGSIRVTASHPEKYTVKDSVAKFLREEKEFLSKYSFDDFLYNISRTKFKTVEFIKNAVGKKQKVHLLGASTKGNTLLQVFGIDNAMVEFAAEVNPDKFGLRTIGSNVEIISEVDSLLKHPDYYLVPIWHFKDNLLSNNRIIDYLKSGGKLIFPLPEFTIISMGYSNTIIETRI